VRHGSSWRFRRGLSPVHPDFFPFISSNSFFVDPLSSYKQKDNLVALSGALGLKTLATIHELIMQIKSHLNVHPKVQQNAHFSKLFLPTQQHQVDNGLMINSVEME
jgi:hypothetical protein